MATNFLWGTVGSVVHLLTTELNSLASGSGTAYGSEVGAANDPQLGTLYLHIASNSLAFTSSSYVKVFFVPSTTTASGATYPTYTSGSSYKLAESNYLAGVIYINPATQSSNVVDETLPNVIMPAGFFKTILVNQAGVMLPASGNTLDFYPTPTQY
ncbi:MAG TPA: hypothetical protein VJQ06_05205 [Rhizomicrobium sp.]|nr:hypothetical protein [Rhizomicrobium sp.]